MIAALAERYRRNPPPAAFRAIVSPLVVWIWIGGGIAVLGALVALWPSPEARLRRVRSLYARAARARAARAPRPRRGVRAGLIVLAALVAMVVLRPAAPAARPTLAKDEARIEELEAAKEAKYREIRDAELDHRMGKISRRTGARRPRAARRGDRGPAASSTSWRGARRRLRAGLQGAAATLLAPWKRFSADFR